MIYGNDYQQIRRATRRDVRALYSLIRGGVKREELLRYKSPVEIEMMRAIKRTLDPQGLMNPGKLL